MYVKRSSHRVDCENCTKHNSESELGNKMQLFLYAFVFYETNYSWYFHGCIYLNCINMYVLTNHTQI